MHVHSSMFELRLRLCESDSLVLNQSAQVVGHAHGLENRTSPNQSEKSRNGEYRHKAVLYVH